MFKGEHLSLNILYYYITQTAASTNLLLNCFVWLHTPKRIEYVCCISRSFVLIVWEEKKGLVATVP